MLTPTEQPAGAPPAKPGPRAPFPSPSATDAFDPGNPSCWRSLGRSAEHAAALADVWQRYPDLPPSASLVDRMARGRERIAAMRPLNDAISQRVEAERQAGNFTFSESKAAGGAIGERDLAILRGRDEHGFDWDRAVAYADGWYAAHAGWPYRGCSNANARALAIPSGRDKAYDDGFADGGGDRGDLFDVARRGILAALRADNQRANARPRLPARPLPSSWPKPTDHARSTRWSRRLVVLSEVLTVEVEPGVFRSASLPMDLARLLARGECAGLVVVTLGNAGFSAGFRADGYGPPLSPTRADAIIADPAQLAALRTLVDGHEFDDVLIAAQGEYLRVIDAFAATLPLCRTMERTRNSLLLQRSQLQCWIDRGRSDESNTGAGHIRWGKAIKGLVGKLGEITVRHVGPAPGRGHLVRVEIGPGSLATGYVTPTGDLLEPELVVSNKANLRREMAAALRAFCGATRLT